MTRHPLSALDRLHGAAVGCPWLQRLAAGTRILLAIGFIPPGLVKVLGLPFTRLGPEQPVGAVFEALYHTGPYYHFIGWGQVLAAALLLLPWTATLGAVVYLPIILNIAVVTVDLDFRGTPVITWLMLLGNAFLLCWDYDVLNKTLARSRPM
jgi:uncharacterized membrane protein YphA (DoxX/SURF4 family)